MIPQKDLDQLIQYYKGELTENALLNKAATLAAKKHVSLADLQLPPAIVNARTKPLSQELTKLTKRIRQFPGGAGAEAPGGPQGEEEEEGFGDWSRGTMVQTHDKRQAVYPKTTNHSSRTKNKHRYTRQKKAKRPRVEFPLAKPLLPPVEEKTVISLLV